MRFGAWAVLLTAAIASGALTCAALVVRARLIAVAGALASASAGAAVAAAIEIWRATGRIDAVIASAFIGIAASAGGFALASSLTVPLTRGVRHEARSARRRRTCADDDGLVHVVLLSDSEQEAYTPRAVSEVLDRYEAYDAPLPPEVAKPLVYAAERSRYRRSGGSPSRAGVRRIATDLTAHLGGAAPDVAVAYCHGTGQLAPAIDDLACAGARRIVVAPLAAAMSLDLDSAVSAAQRREHADLGVRIEVADPLWSDDALAGMLAARIVAALAPSSAEAGVCLVSLGEPEELADAAPAAAEQSTYLVQRVRAKLIEAGLSPELVRRAWLEWEEPDVSDAARHLGAMGAHRIAIVPVTFPVESLDTVLDLQFIATRVSEDLGVPTTVLPAWGADPVVIAALTARIEDAMGRFRS